MRGPVLDTTVTSCMNLSHATHYPTAAGGRKSILSSTRIDADFGVIGRSLLGTYGLENGDVL